MIVTVDVLNQHAKYKVDEAIIKDLAAFVFLNEWYGMNPVLKSGRDHRTGTLSLVFLKDTDMKEIHTRSHGDSSSTDVISYGYFDTIDMLYGDGILAEIFICIDYAQKMKKEWKHTLSQEVMLYVVHGILHLFGYDDIKARDIKKMRMREAYYMNLLKHLMPCVSRK